MSFDIDRFLESGAEFDSVQDQVEIQIPAYHQQLYDREPYAVRNENFIFEKNGSNYYSSEYMDSSSSPQSSEVAETTSNRTKKSYTVGNYFLNFINS